MRRQTLCICECKDADQLHSNCDAKLISAFCYMGSTTFYIQTFQPLAILCACTARSVSPVRESHCFVMVQLIYSLSCMHDIQRARVIKAIETHILFEPQCKKTGFRGFPLGLTQIGLYSHR